MLPGGWEPGVQYGVKVDEKSMACASVTQAERLRQKLIADGHVQVELISRRILTAGWEPFRPAEQPEPTRPAQRRFVKEVAKKAPAQAPKANVKKVVVDRADNDPSIAHRLFESPVEQLNYEIKHWYLYTVPLSQRQEWPLLNYQLGQQFTAEVDEQSKYIARGQIIAAIVDVVSGRAAEVPARKARLLRVGGGEHSRPPVVRGDGAVGWRANVSANTPAARRIMWWKLPSGNIELARLATHDDIDM